MEQATKTQYQTYMHLSMHASEKISKFMKGNLVK